VTGFTPSDYQPVQMAVSFIVLVVLIGFAAIIIALDLAKFSIMSECTEKIYANENYT